MNKSFKNRAAAKQKKFIEDRNIKFEEHCILYDKDALQYQLVNWPGLLDEVKKNMTIINKKKKIKMVFKNMLRSEHIPYNFFIPLKLNSNQEEVLTFFKEILDRTDLLKVTKFEIEWSPKNNKDTLNDKTSFDVYLQFSLVNKKVLGLGIEVKFTEQSYPYKKTEELRLKSKDETISSYYKIWNNKQISIYEYNTYDKLGRKEYKQFFRNHLLGLSMINNSNAQIKIDEFISMHLFPEGNTYQSEKAQEYNQTIRADIKGYFKAITFENFIDKCNDLFKDKKHQEWLEYLKERYIVK